jgi:Ion channel regulatory protein UNC-93
MHSKVSNSYPNFKVLILYSFGFFVTMFAFFSAASVYSKVLKEKGFGNLGFYGLAVLYVSLSMSSFVAPTIASMLKTQRVLQIGTISFTAWVFTGYVATIDNISETMVQIAVILGSIINGFGGSIFWVAQGKYLSHCVRICEEKSGMYTSVFWTICLGS